MVCRRLWLEQIKNAWARRPLIWLAGVRRVGKTYLCQSLLDIEYFDCELPRVRLMMADPQSFLSGFNNRTVVLDEIHRLPNPSELLKIATDHFPGLKVVATGSSTLGASAKFRDTLVGRKAELWLTPMIFAQRIKQDLPQTTIVMLTVRDEDENLFQAIRNGAQGYVVKKYPLKRHA